MYCGGAYIPYFCVYLPFAAQMRDADKVSAREDAENGERRPTATAGSPPNQGACNEPHSECLPLYWLLVVGGWRQLKYEEHW
jgi:hypothetical protein